MLVFPVERRVRPPDFDGRGRSDAPVAMPSTGVRAIVHPAATIPPASRYVRPLRAAAAPREPRLLQFPSATPRAQARQVRAIVHANPPVYQRVPRTMKPPQAPREPRTLQFAPTVATPSPGAARRGG